MAWWHDLSPRGRVLAIVAVVALAVGIAFAAATGGRQPDPLASTPTPSPTASPTSIATVGPSAAPEPSEPSGTPSPTDEAPEGSGEAGAAVGDPAPLPTPAGGGLVPIPPQPEPPTVTTLDADPVGVTDGVSASLSRIRAVDATASAPGERSGPAVAATVRLTNSGSTELDLTFTSVSVFYGTEGFPASLVLSDPASRPFSGSVPPGATVEATYVALVPPGERDLVAVVLKVLGAPDTVFEGRVTE